MVHDSAATGFQQEAGTYDKARPSYHPALVARVVESFTTGVVVEIGAGTGIFTAQLVASGVSPIAIEPVAGMRATLSAKLPAVEVLDRTAEATGLPDNSVDSIIVAQAFHWFNHRPALAEIRRVLRPGGTLACVWNVRDLSIAWVRGYTDIMDRQAGDAPRAASMEWRRAIDSDGAFEPIDDWSIPNPRPSSPDNIVARARSTSFIAALAPDQQGSVLAEVRELVEPLGETFDNPYVSEVQAWRLRDY